MMDKAAQTLYDHRYGYQSDEYGWEWAACHGCSWPDGEQLSRGAGYERHYQHQADLIREQISEAILERGYEWAMAHRTDVKAAFTESARIARGES